MSEELDAGRDLDALVAEKVMGWVIERRPMRLIIKPPEGVPVLSTEVTPGAAHDDVDLRRWWPYANGLPHYSTDIAAAWKVLSAITARPDVLEVDLWVTPGDTLVRVLEVDSQNCIMEQNGPTAALAICRAAVDLFEKVQDEG